MEGLEPEPCVSWSFSYAQRPTPPYCRQGWVPGCWIRSPEVRYKLVLLPLNVHSSLSQQSHVYPGGAVVLEQEGLARAPNVSQSTLCDSPSASVSAQHSF